MIRRDCLLVVAMAVAIGIGHLISLAKADETVGIVCYGYDGLSYVNQTKCPGSNACCGLDATCLSNRLCQNPGAGAEYIRGPCFELPWDDITQTYTASTATSSLSKASSMMRSTPTTIVSALSSSATSASAATMATQSSESYARNSGLNKNAKVGIATGTSVCALAVIIMLGIGALLLRRTRFAKKSSAASDQGDENASFKKPAVGSVLLSSECIGPSEIQAEEKKIRRFCSMPPKSDTRRDGGRYELA